MPKWFQVIGSLSGALYGGLSAFNWTTVIGNQHTLGAIAGILGILGTFAHAFQSPAQLPPPTNVNGR